MFNASYKWCRYDDDDDDDTGLKSLQRLHNNIWPIVSFEIFSDVISLISRRALIVWKINPDPQSHEQILNWHGYVVLKKHSNGMLEVM